MCETLKKKNFKKKKLEKKLEYLLFRVYQNTQISSYVENIFTQTPNQKFDVCVNIFSTYEEMEPLRFGSKIEHQSFEQKKMKLVA